MNINNLTKGDQVIFHNEEEDTYYLHEILGWSNTWQELKLVGGGYLTNYNNYSNVYPVIPELLAKVKATQVMEML